MNERAQGLAYFFKLCAHKYANEHITEMKMNWGDRGNENEHIKEYSMCYHKDHPHFKKYCGPDWTFHHWPSANIPSFQETVAKMMVESMKPPTVDKVGWVGNIYSPSCKAVECETRPLLKKIGDDHPENFDIIHIHPVGGKINESISTYVSLPDLVKYKYLIDIGGNGYSGRLKYLLFSKRPLLIVDRNYIEYFHDDLVPYTHYVPVNMDLSNLVEQVEWMRTNPQKVNEMAQHAYEYAVTHFTMKKLIERVHVVYNQYKEA